MRIMFADSIKKQSSIWHSA